MYNDTIRFNFQVFVVFNNLNLIEILDLLIGIN